MACIVEPGTVPATCLRSAQRSRRLTLLRPGFRPACALGLPLGRSLLTRLRQNRRLPGDLEFDLLPVLATLVLYADHRVRRDRHPLAGHLDAEPLRRPPRRRPACGACRRTERGIRPTLLANRDWILAVTQLDSLSLPSEITVLDRRLELLLPVLRIACSCFQYRSSRSTRKLSSSRRFRHLYRAFSSYPACGSTAPRGCSSAPADTPGFYEGDHLGELLHHSAADRFGQLGHRQEGPIRNQCGMAVPSHRLALTILKQHPQAVDEVPEGLHAQAGSSASRPGRPAPDRSSCPARSERRTGIVQNVFATFKDIALTARLVAF